MKIIPTIYAAFISFLKSLGRKKGGVKTVSNVDIQRYMGRWYEISSYPQWFEKGLTDVSVLYIEKEGYVEVVNSGFKNGKLQQANGRALIVRGSGCSKLKVSFFRPFYGEYWIVDLAEDYSWAVISNPHRSTLWVLCRDKVMNKEFYAFILDRLSNSGFDISKLVEMKSV